MENKTIIDLSSLVDYIREKDYELELERCNSEKTKREYKELKNKINRTLDYLRKFKYGEKVFVTGVTEDILINMLLGDDIDEKTME